MHGRCSTLFDILRVTTCKAKDWSNILPVSVPPITRLLLRPSSQLPESKAPTELVSSCSIYFAISLRSTPVHHSFSLPQPSSILYPGFKKQTKGQKTKERGKHNYVHNFVFGIAKRTAGPPLQGDSFGESSRGEAECAGSRRTQSGQQTIIPAEERTDTPWSDQLGGSHRVRSLSC